LICVGHCGVTSSLLSIVFFEHLALLTQNPLLIFKLLLFALSLLLFFPTPLLFDLVLEKLSL